MKRVRLIVLAIAIAAAGGVVLIDIHPIQPPAPKVVRAANMNTVEVLDLSVPRGAYGLANSQRESARQFLRAYATSGNGRILIRAPSGSPNEVAAMHVLEDVLRVMRDEGVAHRASAVEPYFADGDRRAPIGISI